MDTCIQTGLNHDGVFLQRAPAFEKPESRRKNLFARPGYESPCTSPVLPSRCCLILARNKLPLRCQHSRIKCRVRDKMLRVSIKLGGACGSRSWVIPVASGRLPGTITPDASGPIMRGDWRRWNDAVERG